MRDITIPMLALPSVRTRYSKNSLKDIGTVPRKITKAYGTTCSISRGLLPRKTQIGSRNRMPAAVNTIENIRSETAIKAKISPASRSRFCPSRSPIIAPDPVASITAIPKMTQVTGITILIPASASEPAYFDTKNPSMVV